MTQEMDILTLELLKTITNTTIYFDLGRSLTIFIILAILSGIISRLICWIFDCDIFMVVFTIGIIISAFGGYTIDNILCDKAVDKIENNFKVVKTIETKELDKIQLQEINMETDTFMIDKRKVKPFHYSGTIYNKLTNEKEKPYVVLEYVDYTFTPFNHLLIDDKLQQKLVREANDNDYILLKELHYK